VFESPPSPTAQPLANLIYIYIKQLEGSVKLLTNKKKKKRIMIILYHFISLHFAYYLKVIIHMWKCDYIYFVNIYWCSRFVEIDVYNFCM
jgi:hypothetical protein